jgi:hypothetical protein
MTMVGFVFVIMHGAIGVPNESKKQEAEGSCRRCQLISGLGGIDKFNFNTIPDSWFKVDVVE